MLQDFHLTTLALVIFTQAHFSLEIFGAISCCKDLILGFNKKALEDFGSI
jgi:hypothetical protein